MCFQIKIYECLLIKNHLTNQVSVYFANTFLVPAIIVFKSLAANDDGPV